MKTDLIKISCAAALVLLCAGCDRLDARTTYACTMAGETFRYRDGLRLGAPGAATLKFSLTTYRWQKNYAISGADGLPEQETRKIFLDAARSSPVESTYIFDETDRLSKVRVVSSLVLNTVSGDARIFHRRWVPPAEWRNSDQYSYNGHCKPLS